MYNSLKSTSIVALVTASVIALAACDASETPPDASTAPSDASTPPDASAPPLDAGGAPTGPGTDAGTVAPRDDGGGALPDAASAQPGADCAALKLPAITDDVAVRGPWKAGVRTAKVGNLTVEITYPAKPGSTDGLEVATYDIRDWLPPQERSKVPDSAVPRVTALGGDLYRDVPIDDAYGPYPVVIFIHGTASFRIASGSIHTHWASRGFITLAADYPGLGLKDQLSGTLECGYPTEPQDIPGNVSAQLAALRDPSGDLSFLKGHLDPDRVAISGHSQGACASATMANLPGVQMIMPLSGSTATTDAPNLKSVLYVAGIDDHVIGYSLPWVGDVVCPLGSLSTQTAYQGTPGAPKVKKRLVGLKGGGHLAVTDLCQTNSQGRNAIQEAQADGVCGIGSAVIIGLPYLFDCGTLSREEGTAATNYVTTAALEETLHCKDRTAAFAAIKTKLPQVGEFVEN